MGSSFHFFCGGGVGAEEQGGGGYSRSSFWMDFQSGLSELIYHISMEYTNMGDIDVLKFVGQS